MELVVFSSVQFSHSVVSDSLRPHEAQHARLPWPSPTPRVYSNSCPSSRWCHPAISSSVVPFSSCPQSLLASGSFPMSQHFAWGGRSIGVSASASVLPMNTQDWSPLGWIGWRAKKLMLSLDQFSLSVVSDSATPQTTAHKAPLSISNSQSLLKLISTESVMPYNHLILCHSLLQGIFSTQGSNPGLPHCRQILLPTETP